MKRPIFNLSYKKTGYLFLTTIILNIVALMYCLKIFSSAVSIKNNVGVYINMIANDGNVLPTFLIIPALLCFPANIFCMVLLYKAFSEKKHHLVNKIMFITALSILGIICITFIIAIMVLSHAYSLHEHLHDGITEAMINYNNNSQFKMRIDKLQIQFQCCGSKHYDEWYNISWYDINLMKHRFNNHSTPFSCCSMTSMSTCIHYGIESVSLIYHYTRDLNFSISPFGCTTAIQDRKVIVGWDIIGRIMLLCLLEIVIAIALRLFQSAHSKEYRFKDVTKTYKAWIFGSRVPEDTESNDGNQSQ